MTKKQMLRGYRIPTPHLPEGTYCVKLRIPADPAYTRALLGQLHELGMWASWEKDAEKRGTEIAQRFRQLMLTSFSINECVNGEDVPEDDNMSFYLRQSVTNKCQLEYSNDSITWSLAFDYSLCGDGSIGRGVDILVQDKYDARLQEILDLLNQNIRPDAGVTGLNYWKIATCIAVQTLIRSSMKILENIRTAQNREVSDTAIFGGFATIATGLASLVFPPLRLVMLAVGVLSEVFVGLSLISQGEIGTIAISSFSNLQIRDELERAMYAALSGLAPSFAQFQNSLAQVNPVHQDVSQIAAWISAQFNLSAFGAYLNMVTALHQQVRVLDLRDNACEQIAIGSCNQNFTWVNLGATPLAFTAQRLPLNTTTWLPLARGNNAKWNFVAVWDRIIINYDIPLGCTPESVVYRWTKLSQNSGSGAISYKNAVGTWIQAQFFSFPIATPNGLRTVTWNNPTAIPIYGVRTEIFTARHTSDQLIINDA